MNDAIGRDLRWLKVYAAVTTLALGVLLVRDFLKPERTRLQVLDVERINIVEADDQLRFVLSNAARKPDPVIDGRVLTRQVRPRPGMIFYNDDGDEAGGIGFGNSRSDGHVSASASVLFDQYRQDQTVGIVYREQDGRRVAGLQVWDRPDAPYTSYVDEVNEARALADTTERRRAFERLEARGLVGRPRLFVGKDTTNAALLRLADPHGRPRLVVKVDSTGAPSLEFLDEQGRTVHRVPDPL